MVRNNPEVYNNPKYCNKAAKKGNDLFANLISDYSEHLFAVALLPTIKPKMMADELERAVKELNFVGGFMVVGPTVKPPDHCDFEALYQKAVELDVPLWIHP